MFNKIKQFIKNFEIKYCVHRFSPKDIVMVSDPKCVYCGKSLSQCAIDLNK
jgi:hypothetical protein